MKEHPILFNSDMIRAIQEGRKTMTRRIIKPQPDDDGLWDDTSFPRSLQSTLKGWNGSTETGQSKEWKCPYGQVGDILWVRELHYCYGYWKKNGISKTGKQKWKFMADRLFCEIRYFDNPPNNIQKKTRSIGWYKRSSLFMPKEACRIWLEITGIRVERVQDISEGDAIAEGIDLNKCSGDWESPPSWVFEELWKSINGEESWEANPWVWKVEFKKVDHV